MQRTDSLFIGGEWVKPASGEVIEVISPATEEPVARVAAATAADVDRAVGAARTAFDDGPWPRLAPAERIDANDARSQAIVLRDASRPRVTTVAPRRVSSSAVALPMPRLAPVMTQT